MIANERQYEITTAALRDFETSLEQLRRGQSYREPMLKEVLEESIKSEIEVLRGQLAEYEALRRGEVRRFESDTLGGLPEGLIRARLAAGLTQKALATRAGLKEQQIQRYEATGYAGASLSRLREIAEALGVNVHLRFDFAVPAATQRAG